MQPKAFGAADLFRYQHKGTYMSQYEVEWSREYLRPLLQTLGFRRVDSTHGPLEAGRDFVLADNDRFGLVQYYCAQVKGGDIKAKSETAVIRTILNQLKTAYETPYKDPLSGTEHKIRAAYLIVNGTITDAARNILFSKTGGWLSIIDRSQLDVARYVGRAPLEDGLRVAVTATNIELRSNETVWNDVTHSDPEASEMIMPYYPLQSAATQRLLDLSWYILDPEDLVELIDFLHVVNAINFLLGKLSIGPWHEAEVEAARRMQVLCKTNENKSSTVGDIVNGIKNSPFPLPGKQFARFSRENDETKVYPKKEG